MPIGIGVQGSRTREVALENVSRLGSEKALESLQQIKTHLSQPGRDSGVLTLFNRTSSGVEMTLERKSSFQLLFQKDERLDDTVHALKTMLEKAGKHEAVVELENYLGNGNRIESRKMLEILNRHLPPEGSTLEELYESAGIDKGRELGSGAFGTTYLVNVGGKECVLKEFEKPETLSLRRSPTEQKGYVQPALNESIGSYLTSKKYPNYLTDKVNIAQPTSYLISVEKDDGSKQFSIVNPHTMRSVVKTGARVECHGLIMPKARGKEVGKLIKEGSLSQTEKKQFLKSTLHSLKGLNERGFVHRDVKPQNSYFDRETGTTTFIDTGMLFKSSKNQEKHTGTQYVEGWSTGTRGYMHPRALQGEKHGTEVDLWATGLMALQVDHREAYEYFSNNISYRPQDGISHEWLRGELDLQIKEALSPGVKKALEALRRDIDDPKTIAGFAMECLEKARLPAQDWGNREWAQKTYSELMDHPGLR